MNRLEKALMHALFEHLHHNTDRAVDFGRLAELNEEVGRAWPGALLVPPGDDAAVCRLPGGDCLLVAKMESHCSPCVPRPRDAAATGAGGAMRDVVAMGGRPTFLLDFIGTRPLGEKVIVGPCGFTGKCTCGGCLEMTSGERLDLMMDGVREMCRAMGVFIIGGGLSTSFSDIVPAAVMAVLGPLVTEKPLTKPARRAGARIIVAGETGNDGNDTLYRAGLVDQMRPARALFAEERRTMDASLAVFRTGCVISCSDLGAAGIGAAVCESARYGGFGAEVDLSAVPLRRGGDAPKSAEEVMICETQARMAFQVAPGDVGEVLEALAGAGCPAAEIGEITAGDRQEFAWGGETVTVIPNSPSAEQLGELRGA